MSEIQQLGSLCLNVTFITSIHQTVDTSICTTLFLMDFVSECVSESVSPLTVLSLSQAKSTDGSRQLFANISCH